MCSSCHQFGKIGGGSFRKYRLCLRVQLEGTSNDQFERFDAFTWGATPNGLDLSFSGCSFFVTQFLVRWADRAKNVRTKDD